MNTLAFAHTVSFSLLLSIAFSSVAHASVGEPNAPLLTINDGPSWRLLVGARWVESVEEFGFQPSLPGIKIGGEIRLSPRIWFFGEAALNGGVSLAASSQTQKPDWIKPESSAGGRFVFNPGAPIEISAQAKAGVSIGVLSQGQISFLTPALIASVGLVADLPVTDSFGLRASVTALRGEVTQVVTPDNLTFDPSFRGSATIEPTMMAWWTF